MADATISAMEVVSSFPVPITRLVHRATDLVKDEGLWVDVKFLHANNPGKQVLQHGCKWMSPFLGTLKGTVDLTEDGPYELHFSILDLRVGD